LEIGLRPFRALDHSFLFHRALPYAVANALSEQKKESCPMLLLFQSKKNIFGRFTNFVVDQCYFGAKKGKLAD
jgi:hypothetical protein